MKNAFSRMVALLVCAAMLFGMVPHLGVSAVELETQSPETVAVETTAPETIPEETTAETTEETIVDIPEETVVNETAGEVIPEETGEGEVVELLETETEVMAAEDVFTQEDLLAEMANALTEYHLTKELTLTEDLTIRTAIPVYFDSGAVVSIPEGKTLTVDCELIITTGAVVNVAGTLANESYDELPVILTGGELNLKSTGVVSGWGGIAMRSGTINLEEGGELGYLDIELGEGKIVLNGLDYSELSADCDVKNEAELREMLKLAETYGSLYIFIEDDLMLEDNLVVPENIRLVTSRALISVPKAVTLTNYGRISVTEDGMLQIDEGGTLDNYGRVYAGEGGELRISTGGILNNHSEVSLEYGVFTNEGEFIGNEVTVEGSESTEDNTFSTFEELKKLIEDGGNFLEYDGNEPIVISEDFIVPEGVHFDVYDGEVIIEENVNVVFNNFINIETLNVLGTLTVNSVLYIWKALNISGSLYYNSGGDIQLLYLPESGTENAILTGTENVVYEDPESVIYWVCIIDNTEELYELSENAKNNKDPHILYAFDIFEPVTINSDLDIPANCTISVLNTVLVENESELTVNNELDINAPLAVEEGSTLRLEGEVYSTFDGFEYLWHGEKSVGADLRVQGTLINNSTLMLRLEAGNYLLIGANGVYSGTGTIQVYSETATESDVVLTGIELSNFAVAVREIDAEITEYGTRYLELTPISKLPGDLNGDGNSDLEDAQELLWAVLFESDKYTAEEADFDKSGAVNAADVVYFMWHLLFPEKFSLS